MARNDRNAGDIARAFANAPIVHTDAAPAETPITTDTKVNSADRRFGPINMVRFEPASNAKASNNEDGSISLLLATAHLPVGGSDDYTLTATIRQTDRKVKMPDGTEKTQRDTYLSMPPAGRFRFAKSGVVTITRMADLEDWSYRVVDAFLAARQTGAIVTATGTAAAGRRHSEML